MKNTTTGQFCVETNFRGRFLELTVDVSARLEDPTFSYEYCGKIMKHTPFPAAYVVEEIFPKTAVAKKHGKSFDKPLPARLATALRETLENDMDIIGRLSEQYNERQVEYAMSRE